MTTTFHDVRLYSSALEAVKGKLYAVLTLITGEVVSVDLNADMEPYVMPPMLIADARLSRRREGKVLRQRFHEFDTPWVPGTNWELVMPKLTVPSELLKTMRVSLKSFETKLK